MDFDKFDSAGFLINHLARLFANELREKIAPLGITPGQFPALLELWEQDGQTQSQLVKKLGIEQATLANTLARMEKDGLIKRVNDPKDGRVKLIKLTKKAHTIRDQAYEVAHDINSASLSVLTETEKRDFLRICRALINHVQSGVEHS